MKLTRLLCVLAISSLLPAQAPGKPSAKELADITARGILLFEYDQAAWHATDAVQASHPAEGKVKRYIARKTASGWVVDFGRISPGNDKFLVAYEAVQSGRPEHFGVTAFLPEREDGDFNLAAAKAIDLATQDFGRANRPYNAAVLPTGAEGLFVYLYPAQVKQEVFPLGGDVRYLVSPDGATIVTKRQLHKTILEFDLSQIPAGATSAGRVHSHVLTDLPEDTDVLHVLSSRPAEPEFVGAGGHVFKIATNGKIEILK